MFKFDTISKTGIIIPQKVDNFKLKILLLDDFIIFGMEYKESCCSESEDYGLHELSSIVFKEESYHINEINDYHYEEEKSQDAFQYGGEADEEEVKGHIEETLEPIIAISDICEEETTVDNFQFECGIDEEEVFLPTIDISDESDDTSYNGDEAETAIITREMMRKCVADYDNFCTLSFEIKEQMIVDLADAISMSNAPKQYYTREALKILLDRLDIEEAPSVNWIASVLILFYSRNRIEIEDEYFETIYERIIDWPIISPFLESLLNRIAEDLELNQ